MNDLLKEWKKLAKNITKYDKLYEKGESLISDNLYDSIYERLVEIEQIIGPQKNSPTNKIISNSLINKVEHLVPMISLEHGFGTKSFESFVKRFTGTNIFPVIGEHKVDGISIAIRYEHGQLQYMITRGNGTYGTDVTRQLRFLDVPKEIEYDKLCEIRGEIYMLNSDFEAISNKFSSPRNACASVVQNKNMIDELKIRFLAHNFILLQDDFETYSDMMKHVQELGFEVVPSRILGNIQDCVEYFEEVKKNRQSIRYSIDGVVYKMNNLLLWSELGYNRKYPRYSFAIKFDPISSESIIKDILFQVGKFGTITPVALFDTIVIDGQNISKATLHNIKELEKNNYGPGDKIIVSRSGDTIPYVKAKVYDANRPVVITKCPSCHSELIISEQTLKCPASWSCPAQRLERIEHFCSRNAFNIDGIGPKSILDLIKVGIKYPSDIFSLPELAEKLNKMDNWSTKSIDNLVNNIEKAKRIDLAHFLYAICIPNVGLGHSKTLAQYFGSFQKFVECYKQDIEIKIPGIGAVIHNSIRSFINNPEDKWVYKLVELIEIL